MKPALFLLLILTLCIPGAFAHLTDADRRAVEIMKSAAQKQKAELDALTVRIGEAETRRSAAEGALAKTEESYGQLQVEHIALQAKVEDVVKWGSEQEMEKHEAQIVGEQQRTRAEKERNRALKWMGVSAVSWLVSAALLAVIIFRRALVAQFPFLAFLT